MFSAPDFDQNMPDCLHRPPITVLPPASTTPEPMNQPKNAIRRILSHTQRRLVENAVCKFGSLCAIRHLFLTNTGSGQADSPFVKAIKLSVAKLRLAIWRKSSARRTELPGANLGKFLKRRIRTKDGKTLACFRQAANARGGGLCLIATRITSQLGAV
jgi:hypothetical protein